MKKHAIIPIFIPHLGCPEKCVFCDQRRITARLRAPSEADVRATIDTWLSTLGGLDPSEVEISFYGGSFTGIPMEAQRRYLSIAKEYVDRGRAGAIHLSTRPDYIDERILDHLASFGVKTIELGVQSFDDEVLAASDRGHDAETARRSCRLIRERGFALGIQLMIGLPCDSREKCLRSARETVTLKPNVARLYPTLILPDTPLYEQYLAGTYVPLTREEAVATTAAMYRILREAGITIMRVGLKSTDRIGDSEISALNPGTWHPAFRQLVEGRIAREDAGALLEEAARRTAETAAPDARTKVDLFSAPSWFSNLIGNGGENRRYFGERFPALDIAYRIDKSLPAGSFRIDIKE